MSEPCNHPDPSRRSFLQKATVLLGGLAAILVGVPFVSYLLGAVRKDPKKPVNLGAVGKFPVNETRLATFNNPIRQPWDGMAAQTGVYVRNLGEGKFLVFAMNCAHLGCPVTWFPQSGLFMCPCHGGVYYENGERASGPPPRGLYQCNSWVEKGELWIDAPFYPTLQNYPKHPARA